MSKKLVLLVGTFIGIVIIIIAYLVIVGRSASPFPINSPQSATMAIDQLAQAIKDKDEQKALSFLATRNGIDSNRDAVLYAIQGNDQNTMDSIIQLLRSRRFIQKYHSSQETFYSFEVTSPADFKTSTIRVHQYNEDNGAYSDEGIEFN